MTWFRGTCGWLVIFSFCFEDFAAAQTKLELKFTPDETVRQQLIQTTKIDVTPPGKTDVFTTQIDQSWMLVSKTGLVQNDGSAQVQQHFSQIAMTIQLPAPIAKRIAVDTAQPTESEDKAEKNIQAAVSRVLNLDWLITFQKNGEVRKVGLSDELANVLVDNPQVGPLMDTFTESGLRKLSEQSAVTFPDKPVSKGDKWQQTITNDFPDGKLVTTRDCTFEGVVEDDLHKIAVKLTAEFQPTKSSRNPMELTSSSGGGEVHFDPRLGRIVRSRFQQSLSLRVGPPEKVGAQKITLTTILLPAEDAKKQKK